MLRADFELHAVDWILNRSLAKTVLYKEMFLDKEQLAGARQGISGSGSLLWQNWHIGKSWKHIGKSWC